MYAETLPYVQRPHGIRPINLNLHKASLSSYASTSRICQNRYANFAVLLILTGAWWNKTGAKVAVPMFKNCSKNAPVTANEDYD